MVKPTTKHHIFSSFVFNGVLELTKTGWKVGCGGDGEVRVYTKYSAPSPPPSFYKKGEGGRHRRANSCNQSFATVQILESGPGGHLSDMSYVQTPTQFPGPSSVPCKLVDVVWLEASQSGINHGDIPASIWTGILIPGNISLWFLHYFAVNAVPLVCVVPCSGVFSDTKRTHHAVHIFLLF